MSMLEMFLFNYDLCAQECEYMKGNARASACVYVHCQLSVFVCTPVIVSACVRDRGDKRARVVVPAMFCARDKARQCAGESDV